MLFKNIFYTVFVLDLLGDKIVEMLLELQAPVQYVTIIMQILLRSTEADFRLCSSLKPRVSLPVAWLNIYKDSFKKTASSLSISFLFYKH